MEGIYNRTSRKQICAAYSILDTFSGRLRGLMFRRKIERPLVFIFDSGRERSAAACAIHSLFVFFPFSAIYLDKNKKVIGIRTCSPFFSFVSPKKSAAYLIEGKPELAKLVKIGDILEF